MSIYPKQTIRVTVDADTFIPGALRIHVAGLSLDPSETRDLASSLSQAAEHAERLPSLHERHVNLMGHCALCVAEAGGQVDRLTFDEETES